MEKFKYRHIYLNGTVQVRDDGLLVKPRPFGFKSKEFFIPYKDVESIQIMTWPLWRRPITRPHYIRILFKSNDEIRDFSFTPTFKYAFMQHRLNYWFDRIKGEVEKHASKAENSKS